MTRRAVASVGEGDQTDLTALVWAYTPHHVVSLGYTLRGRVILAASTASSLSAPFVRPAGGWSIKSGRFLSRPHQDSTVLLFLVAKGEELSTAENSNSLRFLDSGIDCSFEIHESFQPL